MCTNNLRGKTTTTTQPFNIPTSSEETLWTEITTLIQQNQNNNTQIILGIDVNCDVDSLNNQLHFMKQS